MFHVLQVTSVSPSSEGVSPGILEALNKLGYDANGV